jgi:hypothetical protein
MQSCGDVVKTNGTAIPLAEPMRLAWIRLASVAEKTFHTAQSLPESAQTAVLEMVEQLALRYPAGGPSSPLTLPESAGVRGKFAAWEEDGNARGGKPMTGLEASTRC